MPDINVERHQSFSCSGSNFTTYGKHQFLMVAQYWDVVKPQSNSPLAKFGKRRYGKCVKACIEGIEKAVREEFERTNVIAKEVLLHAAVLVMRFTLHPRNQQTIQGEIMADLKKSIGRTIKIKIEEDDDNVICEQVIVARIGSLSVTNSWIGLCFAFPVKVEGDYVVGKQD